MVFPNKSLAPILFAIVLVCCSVQQAEEPAQGLMIIHPKADDPKAFIRNNRCMIGGWALEKSTAKGWVGAVHYPVRNDSPDVRYMVGDVKVIKPASEKACKAFTERKFQTVMLAESKKNKGYYEVVGYAAPAPPMKTSRWLPISRGLDLADKFFQSSEYRASDILPTQIKRLHSDDAKQSAAAAYLLRTMGEDARIAVPKLIEQIENENHNVAGAAMLAVAEIGGSEAKTAVPKMVKRLHDPKLRSAAIRSLAKFGNAARAGAPGMLKALAAADQERAPSINYIIQALGEVAPNNPDVRTVLRTYLKHRYETTQNTAAEALAKGSDK